MDLKRKKKPTPPTPAAVIRDRIKELRRVKASDLIPNPNNWRTHPQAQRQAMQGLLAEIGYAGAALAYQTKKGLTLIDGHLRAEITPEMEIPVLILDLNEKEANKLLLTFDPLGALAEADIAKLDELLTEVQTASEPITAMLEALADEHGLLEDDADEDKGKQIELRKEFSVLVKCADEPQQKAILTELDRHGLDIRALTVDFPVMEKKEPAPGPELPAGGIKIKREVKIKRTPRVMQCEGLFDIAPSKRAVETWQLNFQLDKPWSIGLIVGPSGSGKTTVARELFGKDIVSSWPWSKEKAVIDDFPAAMSVAEVTAILSSVGFSSPPAWLKPFHVLSNGEQFRVTLARTLAEQPALAVVDEFTSVVDRNVAQIGSAALAKTIRGSGRKFIAVACHYDIEEWLQPDWKVEMPSGGITWRSVRRRPEIQLSIRRATSASWELFRRHHYLTHKLHPGSQCFLASVNGQPAAFTAVLHCPGRGGGFFREHRTVCLPDFQGVGIGNRMSEFVAGVMLCTGKGYGSTTSHPAMIRHRINSPHWRCVRKPSMTSGDGGNLQSTKMARAAYRLTAGFAYCGPALPDAARALGILD